ncbi:MAG: hypothetical protein CM1200mP1_11140 [Candidatus Neomarinimicrobiota bacterium]|nr:MAG: hypothetical protein CM1200mP1_11140 [Candidatus Neomarinimicrobiota bacterium]
MDYRLTESINTKYGRAVVSNMNDNRGYIPGALAKGDFGFITDITENFNSSFAPTIQDWLKPTFNYSANYR